MTNPKYKTVYYCSACGAEQPKWSGKCPECGTWNSLNEEKVLKATKSKPDQIASKPPEPLSGVVSPDTIRRATGVAEFDRTLGGGFVAGSVVLLGGEPGIGKSTLMLQMLHYLATGPRLYFSGEESPEQIHLRAERLGIRDPEIYVSPENNLENIITLINQHHPVVVVIDSIQTVSSDEFDNVPGSVTQVRECAAKLLRMAKEQRFILILIGHITKGGLLAGPKVLEHLVDTVLYLEGAHANIYRILRAVKNRFGSTNEVGIFEMKSDGLAAVGNPSGLFLAERRTHVAGSAITVSMEGTRPFLIEVQALVTQTTYGNPQRSATGIDYRRLAMLNAVLEKRVGLPLGTQDIFINVVGGLKIEEPAVDLAVVTAIASSFRDLPLPPEAVVIGEVGLVGEVRSIPLIEQRVRESIKLGYRQIYLPRHNHKHLKLNLPEAQLVGVDSIGHLLQLLFEGTGRPER